MEQPTCPRCNQNPTSQTVQVSDDAWQDVCDACAELAKTAGDTVIPIEVEDPPEEA